MGRRYIIAGRIHSLLHGSNRDLVLGRNKELGIQHIAHSNIGNMPIHTIPDTLHHCRRILPGAEGEICIIRKVTTSNNGINRPIVTTNTNKIIAIDPKLEIGEGWKHNNVIESLINNEKSQWLGVEEGGKPEMKLILVPPLMPKPGNKLVRPRRRDNGKAPQTNGDQLSRSSNKIFSAKIRPQGQKQILSKSRYKK